MDELRTTSTEGVEYRDLNGNGVYDPDESTDQDVIILGGNSIAALANASTRIASPQLQVAASLALSRHALVTFIDALQELVEPF